MSLLTNGNGKRLIMEDLDINPRIIASAKKGGYVTAWSILRGSPGELQQRTGMSPTDVKQLVAAVAAVMIPKQRSAWEMHEAIGDLETEISHITTGCPKLDQFLGGGVPIRGITEVAGESGSGKTQLSLQLALHAQLPVAAGGLNKGVAYICTESQFPAVRLQQLISEMRSRYPRGPKSYTDNIFIHHVPDMDNLVDCVRYQLPLLVSQRKLGLVIIDSVAAVFRTEDGADVNKAILLQTLGYRLHNLTSQYNVGVIAINQVTGAVGNSTNLYGLTGNMIPSLGLSWANIVTSRLLLKRSKYFIRACHAFSGNSDRADTQKRNLSSSSKKQDIHKQALEYRVRLLELVFCPWLGRKCCNFIVNEKGIEHIDTSLSEVYVSDI